MSTPKNEDNIQINEVITKSFQGTKGVLGKNVNMIYLIEEESRNLESETLKIPNQ